MPKQTFDQIISASPKTESAEEHQVSSTDQLSLEQRVDAVVVAYHEVAKLKLKLKAREEELSGLVAPFVEAADQLFNPENEAVFAGEKGTLTLTPKAMKVTNIDTEALIDCLGLETYMALAKVGVGDIRAYLSPPEVAKVLTEERETPRRVKSVK